MIWSRFRRSPLSLAALGFLAVLIGLAVFAPLVVGTRPIVCRYHGKVYFPFLEYYWEGALPTIFRKDSFRDYAFPASLRANDPESWAIWPLLYQDPYRHVGRDEWPGEPGNPVYGPPSRRSPLGTDGVGLDVFAQLVYGSRTALLVGFVSMAIAGAIGVVLGALAGYLGGKVDMLVSRLIEVLMSIPTLVLILAIFSLVDRPGLLHLVLAIGLTRWESIARYTRGEFLRLRESDFVLAARALGASWHRIIFVHILPNALVPVIVTVTFGIANTILLESALSFLGFGVPFPAPSWGSVLKGWVDHPDCWWLAVFPGLAIFASVFTYNLIGDSLQEATSPGIGR